MADASTSGIVAYVLQPVVNFLFGFIIKKIQKVMKGSTVICVVIPASSGKSSFLNSYLSEFNAVQNDLYIIDLEDASVKDLDEDGKQELSDLKKKDILLYHSKLFILCEDYLKNIIAHLKQTKIKKRIVVLVSSVELQKFLNIKQSSTFYYAPSKKLYEVILEKNKDFKVYLDYTRNLLEPKMKAFIYSSFDELTTKLLKDLKIQRTL